MAPVWPLKVTVVAAPLQMVPAVAVTVPPTVTGFTDTTLSAEAAIEQTPLWTTARKCLAAVRLPVLKGLEVEAMGDQVVPSREDSHRTIEPVWPPSVIVVAEPLQTVEAVAAVMPPTLMGLTVTVAGLDSSAAQYPLWTIARN
jgi:hypothetical protein